MRLQPLTSWVFKVLVSLYEPLKSGITLSSHWFGKVTESLGVGEIQCLRVGKEGRAKEGVDGGGGRKIGVKGIGERKVEGKRIKEEEENTQKGRGRKGRRRR